MGPNYKGRGLDEEVCAHRVNPRCACTDDDPPPLVQAEVDIAIVSHVTPVPYYESITFLTESSPLPPPAMGQIAVALLVEIQPRALVVVHPTATFTLAFEQ